jgi:hypothetical protein
VTVLYRAVRWVVLVGIAWALTQTLPSVARYLKMRSM